MKNAWFVLLLLLAPVPTIGQYGQGYGNGPIISCNSDNMRRNFCTVGPNNGVRLYRQHSDAACVEGRTFGVNGNQIWVDRGCRAEFQVISRRNDPPPAAGNIYCASDNGRVNYCSIGPNNNARLVRQRSDAACVQGQTWGVRGNQIWVDRGCRAEFQAFPRGHGGGDWHGGGGGSSTTVYCASDNMRRNYCSVGNYRNIRLVKKRSDAACDLNRTYGFDRNGIWVDRGCRAEFEVFK